MTPFALLEKRSGRGAALSGILDGAKKFVTNGGTWGAVKRWADKSADPGALRKGVGALARGMTGKPGRALNAYGVAGVAGDMTGYYDLPGSTLALTAAAPLISVGFMTPGGITALRNSTDANAKRVEADVGSGSDEAINDFLSAQQQRPEFAHTPGAYESAMAQAYPGISERANYYGLGRDGSGYKPMSGWDKSLALLRGDSQSVVSNGIDAAIFDRLRKEGGWKGKVGTGAKNLLTYALPAALIGGGAYGALSADKPYSEGDAQARGYAATQSEIQKRLSGMSGMERLAARMDPSLIPQKLDEAMPGTLDRWQSQTGGVYNQGWLSKMLAKQKGSGSGKFYEYDAAGTRHYLDE